MPQSLPPKSLVLYAEDDADDIELFQDALRNYAARIELKTFSDGAALLDYLRGLRTFDLKPCLIILDINMPRLDGRQTLQQLRSLESYEEVPVVLFSTSNMPSEQAFAYRYDAGFITKPLHAGQIHQIIDQMLDHCSEDVKRNIRNQ